MDFELHVVRGRSASQTLKLTDGVNSVGRHDDCSVRIKSSQVSRKHCELFEKKGMLLIKDLGSANGTFVNGKKVEGQLVLEPGDELVIGGIKLRVAKVGQAPPTKSVPEPVRAPGDTAVVDAIVVPDEGDDEEFEIDFDDDEVTTAATVDHVKPGAADDGDFLDAIALDDEPVAAAAAPASPPPPAPAAKAPPAPPANVKAKAKTPDPAPAEKPADVAPDMADEAIADFLLDIKLDDDE